MEGRRSLRVFVAASQGAAPPDVTGKSIEAVKSAVAFSRMTLKGDLTWAELKRTACSKWFPGYRSEDVVCLVAFSNADADQAFYPVEPFEGDEEPVDIMIIDQCTYIVLYVVHHQTQTTNPEPQQAQQQLFQGNTSADAQQAAPVGELQPVQMQPAAPGSGQHDPADQEPGALQPDDTKWLTAESLLDFCRTTRRPSAREQWTIHPRLLANKVKPVDFQLQGVQFMIDREREPGQVTVSYNGRDSTLQLPRGGILADGMGLGKTVMCLMLMMNSWNSKAAQQRLQAAAAEFSRQQDRAVLTGGTLLLVPKVLVNQWVDEILFKCGGDPNLDVCVYTGLTQQRFKKNYSLVHRGDKTEPTPLTDEGRVPTAQDLARCRVVVMDYDHFQDEIHYLSSGSAQLRGSHRGSSCPITPLRDVFWERIVLDECQRLGTTGSVVARAAGYLHGHARWCISGTPFGNSPKAAEATMRFLYGSLWQDVNLGTAWLGGAIRKAMFDPDETTRQDALQAVCGLVGAVLLRRKLTEVQEQLQIPAMNITAVEYELHDVPAAVNGLMVATARKELRNKDADVSKLFQRAVRAGLHPQFGVTTREVAIVGDGHAGLRFEIKGKDTKTLLTEKGYFPDHGLEASTAMRSSLMPLHKISSILVDSATWGAAAAAEAAAAAALQLARSAGADDAQSQQDSLQLLCKASDMLDTYMLPHLPDLDKQYRQLLDLQEPPVAHSTRKRSMSAMQEQANQVAFPGCPRVHNRYNLLRRQLLAAKAAVHWQACNKLQWLEQQPASSEQDNDVGAEDNVNLHLAEYLYAAEQSGKLQDVGNALKLFMETEMAAADSMAKVADAIDSLPADAAGWAQVFKDSKEEANAAVWVEWHAAFKQQQALLVSVWTQLLSCMYSNASVPTVTSNGLRSADPDAFMQLNLSDCAKQLLQIPAEQLQDLKKQLQQLQAYKDCRGMSAPAAAGPSGNGADEELDSGTDSDDAADARPAKYHKIAHDVKRRNFDRHQRLLGVMDDASFLGLTDLRARVAPVKEAVTTIVKSVGIWQQLTDKGKKVLRSLDKLRGHSMVNHAGQSKAGLEAQFKHHQDNAHHLKHRMRPLLLQVAQGAQSLSSAPPKSLDSLLNHYGSLLQALAQQLLNIKTANSQVAAGKPITKVVVAVCDHQLMSQALKMCEELDLGAVSLEGKLSANTLRQFSTDTRQTWVLFLRVGHQCHEQSSGLTLTCCSEMIVLDTFPREDLLRQLLGRIHRFGQEKEQKVTFLVANNTVQQALHNSLVKPALAKLNLLAPDESALLEDEEVPEWQDPTDRLDVATKRKLLEDIPEPTPWKIL